MSTQALHSQAVAWAMSRSRRRNAKYIALDGVEQLRAVEALGDHVGEGRVALELGQSKGRLQRPDDGRHQVGQDVLGVIELGAGQIAGVAGDVGDQQTGRLLAREHASLQRGARQSCRVGRSPRPTVVTTDPDADTASHATDQVAEIWRSETSMPPAVRRRATRCGTMNGKRP